MSTDIEPPGVVPPGSGSPAPRPGHRRRIVLIAVIVAVALIAAGTVVLVALTRTSPPTAAPTPVPTTAAPSAPAVPPATGAPSASATSVPAGGGGVTTNPTTVAPVPFGYQPLWPFSSLAAVRQWQDSYRSGGHQPWHLDPDLTATAFTTGYLGFSEINLAISHRISGNDAWVTVGYPVPGNRPGTAAVLHLAKYGSGTDAPWEVVGTEDTTFSLTQPAYGTAIGTGNVFTVGGRITGVDENILVQIRQPSSPDPLGQSARVPAGGTDSPWATTVTFTDDTDPALTVVAQTGGHYTAVERFAITAIRPIHGH